MTVWYALSATCAMYTVKTLQCSFPRLLELTYVAAIRWSRRLCSSGYGIGRWLCRVRLLAACCSLPASAAAPATSAVGPHTHTHTHARTVRVTASLRIHSIVLPSDFLSAPLCSQSFICALLAVCLSLSFFRHPHCQTERLLYRPQYFSQPVVLGFAKQIEQTVSSCTVHSYCFVQCLLVGAVHNTGWINGLWCIRSRFIALIQFAFIMDRMTEYRNCPTSDGF